MPLSEKIIRRRYNALANDWTPLSRKPWWLSTAFHWGRDYVKRNRFPDFIGVRSSEFGVWCEKSCWDQVKLLDKWRPKWAILGKQDWRTTLIKFSTRGTTCSRNWLMPLSEKIIRRRYNALANDWTPLSRKPWWLSTAFHWGRDYVKRNRFPDFIGWYRRQRHSN